LTAIVSTLTSLPFTQFRKNRYFYLWYDGFYAVFCVALITAMHVGGYEPFIQSWDNRFWLILPLACYAQILCSVFIHNCTHNSFPRPINRLVGELCGVVVLTRFASWEVIHQRHHRFSDNTDNDPHPVVPSYWAFLLKTVVGVERQLQRIYFEVHGGDTPENRRYEKYRAYASYTTNLLLIYTWFMFLGPIAFGFFFVISAIVGFLHLVHFNWSTHNAFSAEKDFRPVNLNHGLYKLGNFLCFGIYMHANHHKRTNIFNPAKMKPSLPIEPPPRRRVAA
jgi:stearoyl-CoA desaturase (delta-9 desaturase)